MKNQIINFCFCCLKTPDEKENLIKFKAHDKQLYNKLTENVIESNALVKICLFCKKLLHKSVKFKNLCQETYKNQFECDQTFNEVQGNQLCEEIIITVSEEQHSYEDYQVENDDNDDDDDIPISVIKEQLISQGPENKIIKLLEIENINEEHKSAPKNSEKKLKCLKNLKIKEHTCSFNGCDKIFHSEFRLKTHLRIHFNEKPYSCDWKDCSMKFTQPNALKCHKSNLYTIFSISIV